MSVEGKGYGAQIGNETYSVVTTDEDWEKRRIDRERQRRLSQETNRRRKALEERKKLAEDREARKRILQLAKRRQRQSDATEKYQRSHTKNEKHVKNNLGMKRNPSLESVLQQLRSGSTEINYGNVVDERFLSSQTPNEDASQFELEAKMQHKQQIAEPVKTYIQKEFDEESRNDEPTVIPSTDYFAKMEKTYAPAQQPLYPGYNFSNVDLMSGQMNNGESLYQSFYDDRGWNLNTNQQSMSKQSNMKFQVKMHSQHYSEVSSQLWEDDARKINIYQPEESHRSLNTHQHSILQPSSGGSEEHYNSSHHVNDSEYGNSEQVLDNQDSLHGSGSSDHSFVFNNMTTSFQKKYDSEKQDTNYFTPNHSEGCLNQQSVTSSQHENPSNYQLNYTTSSNELSSTTDLSTNQNNVNPSNNYGVQNFARSPNYYVKSFRPWSATENRTRGTTSDQQKVTTQRPMSAMTHALQYSSKDKTSLQFPIDSICSVAEKPNADMNGGTSNEDLIREISHVWSTNLPQTTATPISVTYKEAWTKLPEPSAGTTVMLLPRKTMSITSTTTACKTTVSPVGETTHSLPASSHQTEQKVSFNVDVSSEKINRPKSPHIEQANLPTSKSILRKVSKYDKSMSSPLYQSAAVARQQWVDHITRSPYKGKLNCSEVRDVEKTKKNVAGKSKSVRWHEVQYSDGTSAVITESGAVMPHEAPLSPNVVPVTPKRLTKSVAKSPKQKPAASKPKNKSLPSSDKGGRKGMNKGRGKKGKQVREKEVAVELHPPPTVVKKKLTMSTSLNYSIPSSKTSLGNTESTKDDQHDKDETTENHRDSTDTDVVTMDTLKSSGSPESSRSGHMSKITNKRGITTNIGNQVTIRVVSPDLLNGSINEQDNNITHLVKSPTDEEINLLWEKLRTCIAQRPGSKGYQHLPLNKSASDPSRLNEGSSTYTRRSAWTTPASGQQRPSIVSIDGGLFSNENVQSRNRLFRPNSAVTLSSKQSKQSKLHVSGAFLRKQALLQQRQPRSYMGHGHKPDAMRGMTKYSPPSPSNFGPISTQSARMNGNVQSGSTAAFLLAETLAEQNMSESQIIKAMDSLQQRTKDAQLQGKQVMPSALSLEEQHLLKSLEQLNSRLREVENAVSANNNATFFNASNITTLHRYPAKVKSTSVQHRDLPTTSAGRKYLYSQVRY